jgi:hypothetical protein
MCKQTKAELEAKRDIAVFNCRIEIFCALLVVVGGFYSRQLVQNLANDYDEKTITPSDYTLYFFVDKQQVENFNKHFYRPERDTPRGEQFRDWIWH